MRNDPDYVCRPPRAQLLVSSLPSIHPHFCLVRNEVIGLTVEHFRGQIAPILAAQATLDSDRLDWELVGANRDVSMAPLAGDDELLTVCRPQEHEDSIGEYKANVHSGPHAPYV